MLSKSLFVTGGASRWLEKQKAGVLPSLLFLVLGNIAQCFIDLFQALNGGSFCFLRLAFVNAGNDMSEG